MNKVLCPDVCPLCRQPAPLGAVHVVAGPNTLWIDGQAVVVSPHRARWAERLGPRGCGVPPRLSRYGGVG